MACPAKSVQEECPDRDHGIDRQQLNPLEEAAAAHRALEEGTSVGKVVLAVGR